MMLSWLRRLFSPTEGHRLAEALIAETDAGTLSWKPYANRTVGYKAIRGDTEVTIALLVGSPMLTFGCPGAKPHLYYDASFAGSSEASAIWRLFRLVDGPHREKRSREIASLKASIP